MKPQTYVILVVALLCAPALAQQVEIFGGAQYEHLESSYNALGWNASLTGIFNVYWELPVISAESTGVAESILPCTTRLRCSLGGGLDIGIAEALGFAWCRRIG